jgi:hypothetical protein
MTTLFQVLLDTARTCGVLASGFATKAGSNEFLIDNARVEYDDFFTKGTLFILTGALQNRSIPILDFWKESGAIKFAPQSTYTSIGDRYSASNQNRDTLVQAVNLALTHMGMYTAICTDLILKANTIEYVLPEGVSNIVRVEAPIVYDPTNSLLAYNKQYHWEEDTGKLRLKYPIVGSNDQPLRIYYNRYHPEVSLDSDEINPLFHRQRLMWTASYFFEYERLQFSGNSDQKETMLMQTASLREMQMAQTYPVKNIPRDPILEIYR